MLHLQHFLQSGLVRPCWMCQRPCGETGVKLLSSPSFYHSDPTKGFYPTYPLMKWWNAATKQNSPLVGLRKILPGLKWKKCKRRICFPPPNISMVIGKTFSLCFPLFSPSFLLLCGHICCWRGEYCCLQLKPDKTCNTIAVRRLENTHTHTHTAAQQNSIMGKSANLSGYVENTGPVLSAHCSIYCCLYRYDVNSRGDRGRCYRTYSRTCPS